MEPSEVQTEDDLPYIATFLSASLISCSSVLCVPDEKCNRNK